MEHGSSNRIHGCRATIALCALLSATTCNAQDDSPLSLSEFRRQVGEARGAGKSTSQTEMDRLAAARRVEFRAGNPPISLYEPQWKTLASTAQGNNAKASATIQATLDSANALLRVPSDLDSGTAGDARAEAESILRRTEFVEAAKRKVKAKNWFEQRITEWLRSVGDWFRELLGGLRPGKGSDLGIFGEAMKWLFFFVAAAGGGVAMYFAVDFLLKRLRRSGTPTSPTNALDGLLSDDIGSDPLERARAAADSGDFRSAIRLAYIASLRKLRASGLLVLEPNRTNWEYQRALRARSPEAFDALLPATRLFDRAWYGFLPTSRADFDSILRAYDSLPVANMPTAEGGDRK